MKKPLLILAAIALSACSSKTQNYAEYWKTWGDQQLISWSAATTEFSQRVSSFCNANTPLENLQSGFSNLSLQWAELNGFPYKAIADLNLGFELYFWPDKRNMTAARLTRRINQGPLSQQDLLNATAAEKGLLALEWLSFEPDLDKALRCNALPAISAQYEANLKKITEYHHTNPLVLDSWIGSSNGAEANSISLNLLFQQAAQISNRLRTSVNNEGELIPVLSEGWRSEMTSQIYTNSLSSLVSHLLTLSERSPITVNSDGLLQNQISDLNALLADMSKGEYRWKDIQQSIIDTEHLIEGPVAQDLDVLIGFNNFDGD